MQEKFELILKELAEFSQQALFALGQDNLQYFNELAAKKDAMIQALAQMKPQVNVTTPSVVELVAKIGQTEEACRQLLAKKIAEGKNEKQALEQGRVRVQKVRELTRMTGAPTAAAGGLRAQV